MEVIHIYKITNLSCLVIPSTDHSHCSQTQLLPVSPGLDPIENVVRRKGLKLADMQLPYLLSPTVALNVSPILLLEMAAQCRALSDVAPKPQDSLCRNIHLSPVIVFCQWVRTFNQAFLNDLAFLPYVLIIIICVFNMLFWF